VRRASDLLPEADKPAKGEGEAIAAKLEALKADLLGDAKLT
jgi:hypothetical protein